MTDINIAELTKLTSSLIADLETNKFEFEAFDDWCKNKRQCEVELKALQAKVAECKAIISGHKAQVDDYVRRLAQVQGELKSTNDELNRKSAALAKVDAEISARRKLGKAV